MTIKIKGLRDIDFMKRSMPAITAMPTPIPTNATRYSAFWLSITKSRGASHGFTKEPFALSIAIEGSA